MRPAPQSPPVDGADVRFGNPDLPPPPAIGGTGVSQVHPSTVQFTLHDGYQKINDLANQENQKVRTHDQW